MPARGLDRAYPGSHWIRPEKRWAIYWRDRDLVTGFLRCLWCLAGASVVDVYKGRLRLSLDHLDPWSQDGTNHASNLVTSCLSCNSARGGESYEDTCVTDRFAPDAFGRINLVVNLPLDKAKGRELAAAAPRRPWRKPALVKTRDVQVDYLAPGDEDVVDESFGDVDWAKMEG